VRPVVWAMAFACAESACEPFSPTSDPSTVRAAPQATTQAEWNDGPKQPYSQTFSVELLEPRSRRRFTGRGALGVDPGRAMRMILVGPMGARALDVWVTRDAWRMQVPAVHLLRRGGSESPPGLPIGFFRSWFVEPLAGSLLALGPGGALVVRDPAGGTLHVSYDEHGASRAIRVRRRHGTQTETLLYRVDAAGGRATYRDEGSGLEVDVTLDATQTSTPDPDAFVDPDALATHDVGERAP
jgi:hypothetical protein